MPQIDLSRLPAPNVIEPLEYEAILAELVADFRGRYPDYDAFVESDPALKLLETAAYREMLLRWRINEAAKQVMLAFSTGGNLDHLVALADVERQAGESDVRLLRRFRLSLQALSVAGPRGAYEFHSLSADPGVESVEITTPVAGTVRVVVVGGDNADGLPAAALVTAVETALDSDRVRPLTDTVEVLAARNICYQVVVTLSVESGPDRNLVQASAEAAVRAYVLGRHRVGAVVYKSAILGAAHVAGVTEATAVFTWMAGAVYATEKLDVADLAAIPDEWKPVAAFWPCAVASISGGAAVVLDGSINGYEHPATAPADGITVTV